MSALSAEQNCRRALVEARMQGATPSPELVEADEKARVQLDDVRARLLEAMTKAINGGAEIEPPFNI